MSEPFTDTRDPLVKARDKAWLRKITAERDALAAELAGAIQAGGDVATRLARADARVQALEAALYKIGYEPIGHAEATEHEVLQDITDIARAALTPAETPPKYGTCPVCGGMGGAHFTHCKHSPAFARETPPEFDPAWVCGVCGKRHGKGECLGAETFAKPRGNQFAKTRWVTTYSCEHQTDAAESCKQCGPMIGEGIDHTIVPLSETTGEQHE